MKKVAVGIISRRKENGQEEFLLVQSKKDFGEFSGFYYPPGGHIEDGECVSDALVREIKEELSLNITPIREIASTPGDIEGQLTYWWLCEAQDGDMRIKEDELDNAGYFTVEDMSKMNIWPATKNFFGVYLNGNFSSRNRPDNLS